MINGEAWMIRFTGQSLFAGAPCCCVPSHWLYWAISVCQSQPSLLPVTHITSPVLFLFIENAFFLLIAMYFCLSILFITYSLFWCPWLLPWATKSRQCLSVFHQYVSSEFRLQAFCEVLEILSLVLNSQYIFAI